MRYLPLFLIALLFGANPAFAQPCTGYVADVRQVSGQTYDPAQVSTSNVELEIRRVDRDLEPACANVAVRIRPRAGGVIALERNGTDIPANFVQSSAVASANRTEVTLSASARAAIATDRGARFALIGFSSGQFVPPGEYVAELELLVGDSPPRPFTLAVTVAPSLRFVGEAESGSLRISLGEVSNGATGSSTFFFRTNASLRLSITSENAGVLMHSENPALDGIPYKASLFGQPVELTRPSQINLGAGSSGLQSGTLEVSVEPQPARFAGRYSDTVMVEFTAY